jgi:hypothetical protein
MSTVTMQELELETAELLPARETLWVPFTNQSNYSANGNDNGNQNANGLIAVNVGVLNGSFDGNGNDTSQANYSN